MDLIISVRAHLGDTILTRPILSKILPVLAEAGHKVFLVAPAHGAYLLSDLGPTNSPDQPAGIPEIGLWFGTFSDILHTHGMTYSCQVHTWNRQAAKLGLPTLSDESGPHHVFMPPPERVPVLPDAPMVFVENGPVLSGQVVYDVNTWLEHLMKSMPDVYWLCTSSPPFNDSRFIDLSSFDLRTVSWASTKAFAILSKISGCSASTNVRENAGKRRVVAAPYAQVWDSDGFVMATDQHQAEAELRAVKPPSSTSSSVVLTATDIAPAVLFVNAQHERCGVYQMGRRIGQALQSSKRYRFVYIEASNADEVKRHRSSNDAVAVIYNWHPVTQPWAASSFERGVVPIGLIHEIASPSAGAGVFPFRIACDPTMASDNKTLFRTGRHVPRLTQESQMVDVPPVPFTVGSFGFSIGGKRFNELVSTVAREFPGARLRLHLPYSYYCDNTGAGSRRTALECVALAEKSGVEVETSFEFMSELDLVRWLRGNHLNVFFYDTNNDRGCSSTIDYAIAAQRPIAVNESFMFRHVHSCLGSYPSRSLREAYESGPGPVASLYETWSPEHLVAEYDGIIDRVYGNGLNCVLNDAERRRLAPVIEQMRMLDPEMFVRKIEMANVQQAFVFDTVRGLSKRGDKVLAVGAYDDTAWSCLTKINAKMDLGLAIDQNDSAWGEDLAATYAKKHGRPSYDVVFATSVIEHVDDDKTFIEQISHLVNPGGYIVITLDYKDGWAPGQRKPSQDYRLYTRSDMDRLVAAAVGCEIVGPPYWDSGYSDFEYDGCSYSFATLVLQKKDV